MFGENSKETEEKK